MQAWEPGYATKNPFFKAGIVTPPPFIISLIRRQRQVDTWGSIVSLTNCWQVGLHLQNDFVKIVFCFAVVANELPVLMSLLTTVGLDFTTHWLFSWPCPSLLLIAYHMLSCWIKHLEAQNWELVIFLQQKCKISCTGCVGWWTAPWLDCPLRSYNCCSRIRWSNVPELQVTVLQLTELWNFLNQYSCFISHEFL